MHNIFGRCDVDKIIHVNLLESILRWSRLILSSLYFDSFLTYVVKKLWLQLWPVHITFIGSWVRKRLIQAFVKKWYKTSSLMETRGLKGNTFDIFLWREETV